MASKDTGRGPVRNLKNDRELEVTREKLKMLEVRLETSRRETGENPYVRELSQRSIKRLINQLKEEIARYNSGKAAQTT